jgi:hypothetical protein
MEDGHVRYKLSDQTTLKEFDRRFKHDELVETVADVKH